MAQNDIFELLKKAEKEMCAEEISKKLNINMRSIQRNLNKMLEYKEIEVIMKKESKKWWFKLK